MRFFAAKVFSAMFQFLKVARKQQLELHFVIVFLAGNRVAIALVRCNVVAFDFFFKILSAPLVCSYSR